MSTSQAEKHKAEGNSFLQAGKYEEAISSYTLAIEEDATNHVYWSNRSAAFASVGKYEEALRDAEKTVSLKPDWGKGYSRLGAALDFLGRKDEAKSAYKHGLEFDPNNDQLKQSLSQLEDKDQGGFFSDPGMFQKLYSDPRTKDFMNDPTFLAKLSNIKNDPMSCFQDPRIMTAMGVLTGVDFNAAAPSFADNEGFKKEENPPKPSEKKPEASKPPQSSEAEQEKQLGNDAYKKKEFEEALNHYNKAIQHEPTNMIYRLNSSAVYLEMGDYETCIKTCLEAIDVGREHRESYKNIAKGYTRIGNAYYKQSKLKEALEFYNKSLSEFRDLEVVKLTKKIQEELKKIEQLSYINPELAEEEKAKGNEFFSKGKFPEAVKHYTEAIKRNPKDPKLFSNRAACYTKLMEYMLCIKDCDECLKLDPSFTKGYLRRANAYLFLKDPKKAQYDYERVIEIEPANQEARDGVRRCYDDIRKMDPQDAAKDAIRDPAIQEILTDPAMRLILEKMQEEPASIPTYLKDPLVASKVEKLIEAGVIQIGHK